MPGTITILPNSSGGSRTTYGDTVLVAGNNAGSAPVVVGPQIKADIAPVMSLGSVYDVGNAIGNSPGLTSFSFLLDNSAGATATNFLMFDSNGLFAANSGLTVSAPTSGTSAVAAIKAMTAVAPLIIKGYNYSSTVSANQFNNDLKITRGDADGSYSVKPIPTAQAKRNTQYVATLLTFEAAIYIDGFHGLLLSVDAGETVSLNFMVGVNYNRQ